MIQWNIGCSGFHYKHWRGIFYPEKLAQKNWFEYYCRFFNTLELNVTFYRFPQLSFLENWYAKSPVGFRFAVKAPRAITHYKKFNDCEQMIGDFYGTVGEGLKEKLGCVLFQLHPRLAYSEEFLSKVINNLDPSFKNVVEFRHDSWWNADVYEKLAAHNITFCGMSHPTLPKELVINAQLLYYRFHGDEQLYASLYPSAVLEKYVQEIKMSKNIKEAFIFFNNDIHGHAIRNAGEMREMIR